MLVQLLLFLEQQAQFFAFLCLWWLFWGRLIVSLNFGVFCLCVATGVGGAVAVK